MMPASPLRLGSALTVLRSAGKLQDSCGAPLASYNGVSALSNGPDMGTGNGCAGPCTNGLCYEVRYAARGSCIPAHHGPQCVELTQRYFATIYNQVPDWKCGNAIDLCAVLLWRGSSLCLRGVYLTVAAATPRACPPLAIPPPATQ